MTTRLPVASEKRKSRFFVSLVSRNGTRGENEIGVDCVYFLISPRDKRTSKINLLCSRLSGCHATLPERSLGEGCVTPRKTLNEGGAENIEKNIVIWSIIFRSRRLRQIMEVPDTDKSRYFAITVFNDYGFTILAMFFWSTKDVFPGKFDLIIN